MSFQGVLFHHLKTSMMEIPSIFLLFFLNPPLLMTNTMGKCLANLCGVEKGSGVGSSGLGEWPLRLDQGTK